MLGRRLWRHGGRRELDGWRRELVGGVVAGEWGAKRAVESVVGSWSHF
jgi:hypothetical protein